LFEGTAAFLFPGTFFGTLEGLKKIYRYVTVGVSVA
jgi:hypothetical protein